MGVLLKRVSFIPQGHSLRDADTLFRRPTFKEPDKKQPFVTPRRPTFSGTPVLDSSLKKQEVPDKPPVQLPFIKSRVAPNVTVEAPKRPLPPPLKLPPVPGARDDEEDSTYGSGHSSPSANPRDQQPGEYPPLSPLPPLPSKPRSPGNLGSSRVSPPPPKEAPLDEDPIEWRKSLDRRGLPLPRRLAPLVDTGDYDWRKHTDPRPLGEPTPELTPPEKVEPKSVKALGFKPADTTGIAPFFNFKEKDLSSVPVQLPPLKYTAAANLNPDDLQESMRTPIQKSLEQLSEFKKKFPPALNTVKDVIFPIVRKAIENQTGLDKALSKDEVKRMVFVACQMLADGMSPYNIENLLQSAHRGQVVRVKSERDQALSHATFSRMEKYEGPLHEVEAKRVAQRHPTYLSHPEGLSRQSQALPLVVDERNVLTTYPVKAGTEGYVFAVAPAVPEAVLGSKESKLTGGGMRFVPLHPEQLEGKSERVISGNPRHKLLPEYREKLVTDAQTMMRKSQEARIVLAREELRAQKLNSMYASIEPKKVQKEAIVEIAALMEQNSGLPPGKKLSDGVHTEYIYKAVDNALQKMGYAPEEVPLPIKLECWRKVDEGLGMDKSVFTPTVELVKDLASLVVSLGDAVPIPGGEKAMTALEAVGSETVGKILDWVVEKCAKPGQIEVTRYDGKTQSVDLSTPLDDKLEKAINCLGALLDRSQAAEEKLGNVTVPEKLSFLSAALDPALSVLAKVSLVGPIAKDVLCIIRDAVKIARAAKSHIDTSKIREALHKQSLGARIDAERGPDEDV